MRGRGVTVGLLAAALALLAVGIATGEPGVVLQKAAQICTECIGLG